MKKILTIMLAVVLTSVVCAQSFKKQHNPFADKKANTTMVKPELNRAPISGFKGLKNHATKDGAVVDNLLAVNYASYGGADGEYGMQFMLDTNLVFFADVIAPANDKIESTYTVDSAMWVDGTDTILVAGTMSLTYVSSNGDGTHVYTANASLTEIGGTDTYGFTSNQVEVTAIDYMYYYFYMMGFVSWSDCIISLHDAPLPVEFDTVDVVFASSEVSLEDYTSSNGAFQFIGMGSEYLCSFVAMSNTIVGVYDSADIDYGYALILDAATEASLGEVFKANGTVTATDGGYDLVAQYFTYEGNLYNITMHYLIPVAEDTVVMTGLTNVAMNDYSTLDGSYQIQAFDDAQENYVVLNYFSSTIDGSFTYEDCDGDYSGLAYNGEEKTIYSAEFTATAIDGGYHYTGAVLCTDNNVYQFDFNYMLPYAEDTVAVTYTNAQIIDYTADMSLCQFIGANADSSDVAYICYSSSQVAGSYTEADLNTQYTAIVFDNNQVEIVSCNFNVTELNGGYQLHGYFLCDDNHCYELTISTTAGTQGISNVQIAEVSVYPNPFSSKLNVMAEGVQEIQVIDMMGQVVLRQANAGAIDMSALANGAYMIRTVTAKGVSTQKVIKK